MFKLQHSRYDGMVHSALLTSQDTSLGEIFTQTNLQRQNLFVELGLFANALLLCLDIYNLAV